MSGEIVKLAEIDAELQSRLLQATGSSTFYHTLRYQKFLSRFLHTEDQSLAFVDGGSLRGFLPMSSKSGKYGTVLNSSPFFGSYGSPIAENVDSYAALISAFKNLAETLEVATATVIANPFDREYSQINDQSFDFEDNRICQIGELTAAHKTPDGLLTQIDSTAKRNVNKALRSGVKVAISNESLVELENMHLEGMKAIGGKPKPANFFEFIPKYFRPGEDYNLYIATLNDEIIAALLLFYFKDMVEYFVPATALAERNTQPMSALLVKAINDAAVKNYKIWNWGGTWSSQEGVYRFKRKWGAVDREYKYRTIVRNNEILGSSAQELEAEYPYFFVVPYRALNG